MMSFADRSTNEMGKTKTKCFRPFARHLNDGRFIMLFLVGPAHGLQMPRIQLYQRIPTSIAQPMGSCNCSEFTWSIRWDPSARMAAKTPLFRWCAGATREYDSSF